MKGFISLEIFMFEDQIKFHDTARNAVANTTRWNNVNFKSRVRNVSVCYMFL